MNRSVRQLVAGLCAALAFASCAADPDPPEASPTAPASDAQGISVGGLSGSLVRPYSLPTLIEFVKSDWIVDVVIGTVMSTESKAMGAGDVATVLTIDVEASRGGADKSGTLTVRESGGIVTRGEMLEADIEAGVTVELPASAAAELDRTANQLVDSQPNGQEHSEVGQRVLLFIAGEAKDLYVAVRLVQRPDGIFDWYGEPMNGEWDVQVDTAEAAALFALR